MSPPAGPQAEVNHARRDTSVRHNKATAKVSRSQRTRLRWILKVRRICVFNVAYAYALECEGGASQRCPPCSALAAKPTAVDWLAFILGFAVLIDAFSSIYIEGRPLIHAHGPSSLLSAWLSVSELPSPFLSALARPLSYMFSVF